MRERSIGINSMWKKRTRGIKRKSRNMVEAIEAYTFEFPTEFHRNYYWNLKLPVAQDFINSYKTPRRIKRLCIQTLLDRAERLIALKPNDKEKYRVVVSITLPYLWSSQITVFKGDPYFKGFFTRNDEYQKWIPLPDNRNIQTEWGLSIPNDMQKSGYKELLYYEDGDLYEDEIWFIGELK